MDQRYTKYVKFPNTSTKKGENVLSNLSAILFKNVENKMQYDSYYNVFCVKRMLNTDYDEDVIDLLM